MISAASLIATSGQATRSSGNAPTATLNRPSPIPPTIPYSIPDGRPSGSWDRETRITATRAKAIPITTSGPGRPAPTNPTATGMLAASSPVTGATTPIRPTARPWYSPTIPATLRMPARIASPSVVGPGNGSPIARPSATISSTPIPSTTSATP